MTSTTHCIVNAQCARAVRLFARVHQFFSQAMTIVPRNRLGSITSPSENDELKHLQKRKASCSQLATDTWCLKMCVAYLSRLHSVFRRTLATVDGRLGRREVPSAWWSPCGTDRAAALRLMTPESRAKRSHSSALGGGDDGTKEQCHGRSSSSASSL